MTDALVPCLREYTARFGLTAERLDPPGRGRGDAPRPDEPRRRDRSDVVDLPTHGRHPPGPQRRRRAHGRPLLPARLAGRPYLTGRRSTPPSRDQGRRGGRPQRPPADVASEEGESPPSATTYRRLGARRRRLRRGPGLVDLHAHLRQPGREEAETVETGSRAAALGGVHVRGRHAQHRAGDRLRVDRAGGAGARPDGACDVRPSAAITEGRAGERLPNGRAGRASACGCSPTTATACRTTGSCGGPWSTPPGSVVVLAQHCEDRGAVGGGGMHEGAWSSRLGIPGQPGRGRGADGDARPRPGPPHRRRSTSSTCRPPARVDLVRAAKAAGLPVTAEATPHHLTLTDAELRRLRPGLQGQPAAAHRRRRRRREGGARRRHHRRHRHRPRPAQPPRPRSCRSTRRRPGMLGLETALALALTEPRLPIGGGVLAVLSTGSPRDRRAGRPRQADRARPPGQPVRHRPGAWAVDPAALASRHRNTPYAGRSSPGGSATRCSGRAGRRRRRGPAMNPARRGWCWPTGPSSRARPSAPAARRRRLGRGRVQHRLSGYQEIITDPSYAGQIITFTYPHIGNYGINAADDESRRPFCAAWSCATWPAAAATGAATTTSTPSCAATACRHRRHRHPRADPPHPRRGAMPGAFGTATRPPCSRPRGDEPGTDGVDLVAEVTGAEPVHRGRRAGPGRRLRLRHQDDHPAPPRAAGHRRGRAGVDAGRRRARPSPDGVFLSNGPGDPAAVAAARSTRIARLLGRGAGVRHLPRPPDPGLAARRQTRSSCRSATTAATTRCATSRRAGSRSPARTTTTPSTSTRCAGAEVTHVNLNDGVVEGIERSTSPAFSVQYHPEAGPGPHDARLPVRRSSPS